jgi:hypothetical protein
MLIGTGGPTVPADYDRAVAFVREHGDELDWLRVDALEDDGPVMSREQEQRFFAGQRADGGWAPPWAPDYSGIDATCFRLAQGDGLWLGVSHPEFKRAVAFLRARQRPDGSWEEDPAVADLAPPWARPGEQAPRLYLIANCGWWLANAAPRDTFVTTDEAAVRAGAHLERHLAPDGALPSFLHTHWLAAGLWILLGRDDLAYRTLDHLATRVDEDVPAGALAWMLTTLAGLGIPTDHPLAIAATTRLTLLQRPDGSWASEDGPDRDPYATAEALRALIQWRAI